MLNQSLIPLINKSMARKLFPNDHIKFAFVGNHIDRYKKLRNHVKTSKTKIKEMPQFDYIMAVDDVGKFHE